MTKKRIHIENLRIKLPSNMRSQALSTANAVGNQIARAVANAAERQTGRVAIDEIAIGRVQDVSIIGTAAAEKIGAVLNERSRK